MVRESWLYLANLALKWNLQMRVLFLTAVLPHYRVPFHDGVRSRLTGLGIQYDLIFGQPNPEEATRVHCASVLWGKKIRNRYAEINRYPVVWQPALKDALNADIVVIGQENRLLINYILQIFRNCGGPKVALWGHGRNFQNGDGRWTERWKRLWATQCDWWFGYTEQARKIIEAYGFPHDRITVVQNAIDTSEIRRLAGEINETEISELRARLDVPTTNVGVYVGGIYGRKRIDFLVAAAVEVRRRIPDFVLIVVGSGTDVPIVQRAAVNHPFIRYLGPRHGREKVQVLRLGRVFAMPGLVGLAILDCAAAGLPLVTTAYPYHSPEIAYLEPHHNGLMVDDWRNPSAYADALVSVLCNDALHAKLSAGARATAERYTIDHMVQRFCDGIVAALKFPKR